MPIFYLLCCGSRSKSWVHKKYMISSQIKSGSVYIWWVWGKLNVSQYCICLNLLPIFACLWHRHWLNSDGLWTTGVPEFPVPRSAQVHHAATRSQTPPRFRTPVSSPTSLKGTHLYPLQILTWLQAALRLPPASKPHEAGGAVYSMATGVNTSVLCIWELLRE